MATPSIDARIAAAKALWLRDACALECFMELNDAQMGSQVPLELVISTRELSLRPPRPPNSDGLNRALITLADAGAPALGDRATAVAVAADRKDPLDCVGADRGDDLHL